MTLRGAKPRNVTRLVFQRFLDLYNRCSAAMTVKNSHDQRGKGSGVENGIQKLCRLMKQPVSDDQKYDPMTERSCVNSVSCIYITLVAFVVNAPFWPLCKESDKTRY